MNLSVDRANIGAGPAQRPDQVRDPNLPGGERTPDRWFDTVGVRAAGAVHVRQRAPQQRHRPRVRQPRLRAGQDVADRRARSELEFRWEIFNLLNRANFNLPNRIFGNPNFGRISSAKNPREMQFGVRFAF